MNDTKQPQSEPRPQPLNSIGLRELAHNYLKAQDRVVRANQLLSQAIQDQEQANLYLDEAHRLFSQQLKLRGNKPINILVADKMDHKFIVCCRDRPGYERPQISVEEIFNLD